jgi:LuxR family transcriptional regulator, maltose regulon positive regulatory protein
MPLPKVLRTKITPPPRSPRILSRPRVQAALGEALNYRLTLLQAGAGFGKSTALAAQAEGAQPVIWYQVTEGDNDPLVFLLHLCHATQAALPHIENLPIHFLEAWEGARGPLPSAGVVDQCLNALSENLHQPTLMVIDDVHLALVSSEIALILDRMIGLAPHRLHILLAGRPPLQFPNLPRWKAQGDVLALDQSVLAFTAPEIATLFASSYGYELTQDEAELMLSSTEGWAIALQLIWQSLRSGVCSSVEAALSRPVNTLDALFDILTREVFAVQPPDVQDFLLISSTLREMTPEACDVLLLSTSNNKPAVPSAFPGASAAMLAYLRRQELFVVDLGEGGLRYHHIFHRFLRQHAPANELREWHVKAAEYFRSRSDPDSTIYHLLEAGDMPAAGQLLSAGRIDTLSGYLDAFSPETLQAHPALLFYLGDLARLHSQFDEALGWYQQAEAVWRERSQPDGMARALRGQARVYLDTVNPTRAEELLERSLRLSDGMESRESQARLYELLAENKLNAGRVDEAERLRKQAQAYRSEGPSDSQLELRVLLRTGRLEEARQALERRAEAERLEPVHTPRSHRETLLVLSLVYGFLGRGNEALLTAREGTRRGVDLHSPFITALGHTRQGHGYSLTHGENSWEDARQQYLKTIEMGHEIGVPRLLVETNWGLCRAAGFQGDLSQALQYAQEGLEIARQAGDEWVACLIRTSLGASLTLAARYEAAEEWLNQAVTGFHESSDPHGASAARLWLCLGWLRQKKNLRLAQALPVVLETCHRAGYDFLFTRPTLLGSPDERVFIPLLVYARSQGWEAVYVTRLLASLGLPDIEFHPGYQLRVYTLGSFSAWRGLQPIPANGWRREKARQLFEILLTQRSSPLDRDQILEHLWPGADPTTAQRNFKVTLNTLYGVLEPDREPGSESAYIVREGTVYNLRPGADIWIDSLEFLRRVEAAETYLPADHEAAIKEFQRALDLYTGEYLPDARYETWAAAEREQIATTFLRAADQLAELYLFANRPEETIKICGRILAQDNCWERAYRQLMQAFHQMGDRGQVARAYKRCTQTLSAELDVPPAPETTALFNRLRTEWDG